MDLSLHDHGIDDVPAVVDGHEAPDLHLAGALVDVHHADIAAEGIGEVGRIVVAHRLEAGLHPLRVIGVRRERDVLDGLGAVRRALDRELARLPDEVLRRHLEEVRGNLPRLVLDLPGGHGGGGAGHRRGAAGIRAEAVGRGVGVALLDLDVLRRDAQLLGEDLRIGGLVPLPWDLVPKRAMALPVGWMRISQESNILSPRMSKCFDGPAPTISVKLEMPMPISSPRFRFSACSRRRSA